MGEEDGAKHGRVENAYNFLVEVQHGRTHR